MESLRVLIADDEEAIRAALVQLSQALSHQVVAQARDGHEAVMLARTTDPDVILLDIRMPHMDGIEAARAITAERMVPIIIVTAHADHSLMEEAAEAGVFSYLLKPITLQRLAAAISTARARFSDLELLRAEVGDLKTALEARKLIERAKGILMDTHGLKEQEAHKRLQQESMNRRKSMREIAEAIILASDLASGKS